MFAATYNQESSVSAPRDSTILVAAVLAILAHIALLSFPALQITINQNAQEEPNLSLRLLPRPERQVPAPALPLEIVEKKPAEATTENQDQEVKPVTQPQQTEEPIDDDQPPSASKVEITTALFNRWSETQPHSKSTEQNRQQQSFKKSFIQPTATVAAKTESFVNAYGEQHVVTKLNGKDVCYMQNRPMIEDQWGTNIVMFYSCDTTPEFVLDLP